MSLNLYLPWNQTSSLNINCIARGHWVCCITSFSKGSELPYQGQGCQGAPPWGAGLLQLWGVFSLSSEGMFPTAVTAMGICIGLYSEWRLTGETTTPKCIVSLKSISHMTFASPVWSFTRTWEIPGQKWTGDIQIQVFQSDYGTTALFFKTT